MTFLPFSIDFNQFDTVDSSLFLEILSSSCCWGYCSSFDSSSASFSLASSLVLVYLEYSPLATPFSGPFPWLHVQQHVSNHIISALCFLLLNPYICVFNGQLDIFAYMSHKHLKLNSKVIFRYSPPLTLNLQLVAKSCRVFLFSICINPLCHYLCGSIISICCPCGPAFL